MAEEAGIQYGREDQGLYKWKGEMVVVREKLFAGEEMRVEERRIMSV